MIQHSTFCFGSEVIESAYSKIPSPYLVSCLSLKYPGLISWDEGAKFFELLKIVEVLSFLSKWSFQTRFPQYTYNSVYYAAIENRSEAWSWDSES